MTKRFVIRRVVIIILCIIIPILFVAGSIAYFDPQSWNYFTKEEEDFAKLYDALKDIVKSKSLIKPNSEGIADYKVTFYKEDGSSEVKLTASNSANSIGLVVFLSKDYEILSIKEFHLTYLTLYPLIFFGAFLSVIIIISVESAEKEKNITTN